MRARINKRTNVSRETFASEQEKVFQHGRIRDWGASGEAASLREARSRPGGAVAGGVGAKRHPCQFRAAFRVACVGLSGKGSAYAQLAKSLTRCKSSFPKATLSWVLLCVHASTRSHVHAPVFLHAHAPSRTRPHSHAPARPHARAPTCPHPLPHSHARSRSSRGGASPPPPRAPPRASFGRWRASPRVRDALLTVRFPCAAAACSSARPRPYWKGSRSDKEQAWKA